VAPVESPTPRRLRIMQYFLCIARPVIYMTEWGMRNRWMAAGMCRRCLPPGGSRTGRPIFNHPEVALGTRNSGRVGVLLRLERYPGEELARWNLTRPPNIGPFREMISGRLDLPPPFGSGLYATLPAAPLKEEVKGLWPRGNAMRALMLD
jgi:hypothetical protein